VLPWQQPLSKVKEYYGEKIGLYFQVMHGVVVVVLGGVIVLPVYYVNTYYKM
jgi:hypothetical protein